MKVKVFVSYTESRTGGASLSNEPYSQRENTHIEVQLKEVSFTEPTSWYKEPFEIECKKLPKIVYVVLVRYSDGDSFSNSYGNGHIEGVYLTEDEAQEVVESIRKEKYKGKQGYNPWDGHFNGLESVNYHPMTTRKYPMVD